MSEGEECVTKKSCIIRDYNNGETDRAKLAKKYNTTVNAVNSCLSKGRK